MCGKHDLKVPILGMGCWAYGGGEYWGAQSQKDVNEVVRYAVEQGCNFFDTAEAYNEGASETSLGLALQGIPREQVIIGTKISPSNSEPNRLKEHCNASLKRLRTDYVDLYMVHWPITRRAIQHFTREDIAIPNVQEVFDTLMELKAAGKIRFIGVSNFGPQKLEEALATGAEVIVNELPYSLLTRAIELQILPKCRALGIGVLGYMSLLQGLLADIYPTLDHVPAWQRRTRHFDSRRTAHTRHGLPGAEAETNDALASIRTILVPLAANPVKQTVCRLLGRPALHSCAKSGGHRACDRFARGFPHKPELFSDIFAGGGKIMAKSTRV